MRLELKCASHCNVILTLLVFSLQKFIAAIRERFSMIDVAKHQMEVSKKGAKNKLLTLTNEVKIITFPDTTWDLWLEVITCAAQGDLIDVDSKDLEKFKDHK